MQLLKTNPRVSFFFFKWRLGKTALCFFLKKKKILSERKSMGKPFFPHFFFLKETEKKCPMNSWDREWHFFPIFLFVSQTDSEKGTWRKGSLKKREETLSFFFKERLEKETENKNSGKIEWFLLLLLFLFVCLGVQKMRGSGREMEEN